MRTHSCLCHQDPQAQNVKISIEIKKTNNEDITLNVTRLNYLMNLSGFYE